MAAYGDEPVDSYFYSSYNPYQGRYARAKDARWKYESYLSQYGDTSDAFNNQQRAQLKSILSQINPKLTPRLRKANTKDVAVQVNPKRDASVQCSIGPRTLLAMKRDFRRKRRPEQSGGGSSGSPKAAVGVRYPRTLAVYSPIAYRSVTSFLVDENNNNKESSCGEAQAGGSTGDLPESAGKSDLKKTEDGETEKVTDQQKKVKQVKTESVQPTTERSEGKARVRFQVSSITRPESR
ncbi:Zygote arrest protein 1 Oocyte-specific maternal effect factor [Channa argus]|uniref:Zygote arrest protein 1 Oocyte-specific maternal effect factor n=1 Tax=Channa argus TaxID=215402 RepID=A0A6G1PMJ5_CHAAH|nr:Zygote arrest protein 1 Oocyte-specific maternal effect factor [Channa argus]